MLLSQTLTDAAAEMDRRRNGNGLLGVTTGYSDLDELIAGWPRQQTSYVAALQSVGKTLFMLNTALRAAVNVLTTPPAGKLPQDEGKPSLVCMYELEMSELTIATRLTALYADWAHSAQYNSQDLLRGRITDGQWHRLQSVFSEMRRITSFYISSNVATTEDIAADVARLQKDYDVCFVGIDYIQKLGDAPLDFNAVTRQGDISRNLSLLAKQYNTHVSCIIDLNREAEKANRPAMQHVRWGTTLGYDADVMLFLDRPALRKKRNEGGQLDDGLITAYLDKNRHGALGELRFVLTPETGLIRMAGITDDD